MLFGCSHKRESGFIDEKNNCWLAEWDATNSLVDQWAIQCKAINQIDLQSIEWYRNQREHQRQTASPTIKLATAKGLLPRVQIGNRNEAIPQKSAD